MAAGHEIERKFLVSAIPGDAGPGTRILQGYLPLASEDTEVRVRRKSDATVLTVKRGHGLDRGEQEVAIGTEVFEAVWPLTEGLRIEKTRYELPHGDATIELDEFGGELEGLLLAEVEFDSPQARKLFEEAAWLGRDVTDDPNYANRTLAERGRPTEPRPPGLGPHRQAAWAKPNASMKRSRASRSPSSAARSSARATAGASSPVSRAMKVSASVRSLIAGLEAVPGLVSTVPAPTSTVNGSPSTVSS